MDNQILTTDQKAEVITLMIQQAVIERTVSRLENVFRPIANGHNHFDNNVLDAIIEVVKDNNVQA
jgi:hypothetical protein